MAPKGLALSTQENLLLLLVWSDSHCRIVRGLVPDALWDEGYAELAEHLYRYVDRYKKAPADHVKELMHPLLRDGATRPKYYNRILDALYEQRGNVNADYALDQLTTFLRRQQIKQAVISAAPLLQSDDAEDITEAEALISKAVRDRPEVFDDGLRLGDLSRSLAFLDNKGENEFMTGIPDLDRRGCVPARKTLMVLQGAKGAGKSWWLHHLGKVAITQRKRVAHATLENRQELCAMRYFQSILEIAKRDARIISTELTRNDRGFSGARDAKREHKVLSMAEPGSARIIRKKAAALGTMLNNLIIKEFPTGSLSIEGLNAWLDGLEIRHNFIPDILLLDMADNMKLPKGDPRLELGRLYVNLRGISGERNMALCTATQTNRIGADAKRATASNVSEDWSKAGTADTYMTFNQTPVERRRRLARLWVDKSRNDEDHFGVILAQDYRVGQFCIDSEFMPNDYDDEMFKEAEEAVADDGSDDGKADVTR